MKWVKDNNLQKQLEGVVRQIGFDHITVKNIHCYRTYESKAHAYARIWAFPKIFQEVLNVEPAYIIEVISEKYDRLLAEEKIKVIIHELLHIPRNFSGSLLPHKFGNKRIDREVERLYKMMREKR